jgi:hypothetical protein
VHSLQQNQDILRSVLQPDGLDQDLLERLARPHRLHHSRRKSSRKDAIVS